MVSLSYFAAAAMTQQWIKEKDYASSFGKATLNSPRPWRKLAKWQA
jgi:hypothetical protein